MAKRKAKTLTKKGRKPTGSTPGSGKRRSDRVAGGRPSAKRAAGRKVKRAGRRGVSGAGVTRARQTRPKVRKNVRSRASSVAKPAAGRRTAEESDVGEMPLRDLVRGGAPRSPKANRPPTSDPVTPWSQRRSKTAHGMRSAGGTTIYQSPQSTRERYGGMKFAVPKRG